MRRASTADASSNPAVSACVSMRRVTRYYALYSGLGVWRASLRADRKLVASSGSFVEIGSDVGLIYQPTGHFAINISVGSFALIGRAATLLRSRVLNASSGVFVETGQGASLLWNRRLTASAGSFLETGLSQSMLRSRVLQVSAGAFDETGFAANLLRGLRAQPQTGLFTLSGDIALRSDRGLAAAFALFACDGEDVELFHEAALRFITFATGSFVLSGSPVVLQLRSFRALPQDIIKIGEADNVLRIRPSSATLRIAPD